MASLNGSFSADGESIRFSLGQLLRHNGVRLLPFLVACLGLCVGALNLSVSFHKEIDWDTAFWIALTRSGFSTCCLHPLQDSLWWGYNGISDLIGNPLTALQSFFFGFLLLGSILYGMLFQTLFGRRSLSLLAAGAYPLFPLIQNLSAYFEDNLFKIPFLIAALLLIFRYRREHGTWAMYLGIAVFSYACLVAMDALLWGPVLAALILWRIFSERDQSTNSKVFFCVKCLALGLSVFVALSIVHDATGDKPLGSGIRQYVEGVINPASIGIENFNSEQLQVSRSVSYPLEQLEPIFGLLQVFGGESLADLKKWRDMQAPLQVFQNGRPYLILFVIAFHLVNVGILAFSLFDAWRAGAAKKAIYVGIVFCSYLMLFGFNYFYVDVPDERYDHYLILLPLILLAIKGGDVAAENVSDRRGNVLAYRAGYCFISFFIFIGLLHFAFAPYQRSDLYRFANGKKGTFNEYYFSIEEIPSTTLAEELFLAGYAPLKIVNTDGRETGIFAPTHMDKRDADALRRFLMENRQHFFLSPKMIKYIEPNEER